MKTMWSWVVVAAAVTCVAGCSKSKRGTGAQDKAPVAAPSVVAAVAPAAPAKAEPVQPVAGDARPTDPAAAAEAWAKAVAARDGAALERAMAPGVWFQYSNDTQLPDAACDKLQGKLVKVEAVALAAMISCLTGDVAQDLTVSPTYTGKLMSMRSEDELEADDSKQTRQRRKALATPHTLFHGSFGFDDRYPHPLDDYHAATLDIEIALHASADGHQVVTGVFVSRTIEDSTGDTGD